MTRTYRQDPSSEHPARKRSHKRVEIRRMVKDFERQYIKANRDPLIHL